MTEPAVWSLALEVLERNEPCALLLVVRTRGSGPGSPGDLMSVTTGSTAGTVGGGSLEADLAERARRLARSGYGAPLLVGHEHRESGGSGEPSGMICSGDQLTAIMPLDRSDLTTVESALSILESGTMATLRLSQSGIAVSPGCSSPSGFSGSEHGEWAFEAPLGPRDTVCIIGGGHVGIAVADLLSRLPFRPVVMDPREPPETAEHLEWVRIPHAEAHLRVPEGRHAWALVMTPDHADDEEVLAGLSGKRLRYVGMMASRAKRDAIFVRLLARGVPRESLDRVHSPVGLPIGGKSPWEIAVSIAAQLIQLRGRSTRLN